MLTEQDAAKLAAIRKGLDRANTYPRDNPPPKHLADRLFLLRMLDEANECNRTLLSNMRKPISDLWDGFFREQTRAEAAEEQARQMREALKRIAHPPLQIPIDSLTVFQATQWLRWEMNEALRAIAASPPGGESALRKAARYEAALREIDRRFSFSWISGSIHKIVAAALEGGEGA